MARKPALLGGEKAARRNHFLHDTKIGPEERTLVLEVLDSGLLSDFQARFGPRHYGGPMVRRLEGDFARTMGTRFAVSFNSATSALHAAVAASGSGPGEEVVTSPFTMTASASCVLMANAVPVFADIDPKTFCITPQTVRARLTPRTRAVIAVSIFGHPADLDGLEALCRERGLFLIEDAAQAPLACINGRLAGTVARIGVYSLNAHKAIHCGEGGIAVTDDEALYERLCLVRNHGEMVVDDMGLFDIAGTLGWNYRLPELSAAVAVAQLAKLPELTDRRRELAAYLNECLAGVDCLTRPVERCGCRHVYYLHALTYDAEAAGLGRDVFVRALVAEGFPVNSGYIRPVYLEPLYQRRLCYGNLGCPFTCSLSQGVPDYAPGLCPTAEEMYFRRLLVHKMCMYPNTFEDIDSFVDAIKNILDHANELKLLAADGSI